MKMAIAKEGLITQPTLGVLQLARRDLANEQGGPAKLAFPAATAEKYPKEQ